MRNVPPEERERRRIRMREVQKLAPPWTPERRLRHSRLMKGRKPHNWAGIGRAGRRVLWKRSVFERDRFTCKKCGLQELLIGFMQADHIKPKAIYPELQFEVSNGQTLCPNCHRRKTIAEDKKYKFFAYKHKK